MSQNLRYPLDGWMGRNGRQRNRRVVTLEHLREVKSWISWMVAHWSVEAWAVMSEEEERAADPTASRFRSWRRKRRHDEYPENRPEDWLEMARVMRAVADRSREISLWAEEQARLTRERLEKAG